MESFNFLTADSGNCYTALSSQPPYFFHAGESSSSNARRTEHHVVRYALLHCNKPEKPDNIPPAQWWQGSGPSTGCRYAAWPQSTGHTRGTQSLAAYPAGSDSLRTQCITVKGSIQNIHSVLGSARTKGKVRQQLTPASLFLLSHHSTIDTSFLQQILVKGNCHSCSLP